MDNYLEKIYTDVKEWLKFAEAKNGALITFNTACLFFLFDCLIKNKFCKSLLIVYCIGLLISTSILLISYIPKLKNIDLTEYICSNFIKKQSKTNNFLFYKNISLYSETDLLNEYIALFNPDLNLENLNYDKILISQIKAISNIALKKFLLFDLALYIIIFLIIISALILIIA